MQGHDRVHQPGLKRFFCDAGYDAGKLDIGQGVFHARDKALGADAKEQLVRNVLAALPPEQGLLLAAKPARGKYAALNASCAGHALTMHSPHRLQSFSMLCTGNRFSSRLSISVFFGNSIIPLTPTNVRFKYYNCFDSLFTGISF